MNVEGVEHASPPREPGAVFSRVDPWLPLVAIVLPVLVLATLFLDLGTGTAIGARVQLSDALEWLRCGELFVRGETALLADTPWCLRRPEVFVVRAPVQALVGARVSVLVVAQAGLLALAWVFLLVEVARGAWVPRGALVVAAALALFPSWRASIGTGAEWAGLTISVCAVAAALRAARAPSLVVGATSVALAGLAYRARPGNPLLVAGLALLVVVSLEPTFGRARARIVVALALVVGLFAVVWSLQIVGVRDAGHGGNVWGTLYAAAVEDAESYKDAYGACARAGQEGERACWPFLRDATKAAVVDDPRPLVKQLARNLGAFAASGPFARALAPESMRGMPRSFDALRRDLESDVWYAVLWNLACAILWWIVCVVVARRAIQDLPMFARALRDGRAHEIDRARWLVVLVVLTSIGAAGVFALLGHDDGRRHLTTNVPLLVLMPALLWSSSRASLAPFQAPVRRAFAVTALSALALLPLATWVDRGGRETIVVASMCSADAPRETLEVLEAVALSTHAQRPRFLLGASDVHAADVRALGEGDLVLARTPSGALPVFFVPVSGTDARAFCPSTTLRAPESALRVVPLVPLVDP